MPLTIDNYLFEGIIALFVAGFAWGFRSWASTLRLSSAQILIKLETMANEIHHHRIESTEAFARLDERVKALENRQTQMTIEENQRQDLPR